MQKSMVGSLFVEAPNVTVVFLRKNAPNFGIFHLHGYTPTTVAAVEFSLSMPS